MLISFAFAGTGMAATCYMRSWQDFDMVSLAILPLFLFSATFYPLTVYPAWLQVVVRCTPLYQGVALIRGLDAGSSPGRSSGTPPTCRSWASPEWRRLADGSESSFCPRFLGCRIALLLSSANAAGEPSSAATAQFRDTASAAVEDFLRHEPEMATALGDHRYDDRLDDRSDAGGVEAVQVYGRHLDAVRAIDEDALDPDDRADHAILLGLWRIGSSRSKSWPRPTGIRSSTTPEMRSTRCSPARRSRSPIVCAAIASRLDQIPGAGRDSLGGQLSAPPRSTSRRRCSRTRARWRSSTTK